MAKQRPARPRAEGRQIHPIGNLITVDDVYRKRLEAALEERDLTQRDLARRVGVTPATISNIVTGRHRQVRKTVIAAINSVFGWPTPADTAVVDDAYQRIVDGALVLTEDDRETVARLVESFKAQAVIRISVGDRSRSPSDVVGIRVGTTGVADLRGDTDDERPAEKDVDTGERRGVRDGCGRGAARRPRSARAGRRRGRAACSPTFKCD